MEHRVAVRTDRAKVFDGINAVFGATSRKRLDVVNMNEPASDRAIGQLKVKTTDGTRTP
jgi:hypothetical protein